MIAVEAVRSAHDQIVGAVVVGAVLIVVAMCYSGVPLLRALKLPLYLFAGAVLVEVLYPGLVDGRL